MQEKDFQTTFQNNYVVKVAKIMKPEFPYLLNN